MHPVEAYLTQLHASLGAGTPETSGYPALSNLLNAVGESLKPKTTAVIHPANNGVGIPYGGLFSTKELKKHGDDRSSLFGRPLTSDEAQQFTHHVRRIASILALREELDRHYSISIYPNE